MGSLGVLEGGPRGLVVPPAMEAPGSPLSIRRPGPYLVQVRRADPERIYQAKRASFVARIADPNPASGTTHLHGPDELAGVVEWNSGR